MDLSMAAPDGDASHGEQHANKTRLSDDKSTVETENTTTQNSAARRSKRQRTASNDATATPPPTESTVVGDPCRACFSAQVATTDRLLTCSSCALVVHAGCYFGAAASSDGESWICDVCQPSAPSSGDTIECVYCRQPGDAHMRRVSTATWPPLYREGSSATQETVWAHLQCALWDPFVSASSPAPVENTTTAEAAPASHAPPSSPAAPPTCDASRAKTAHTDTTFVATHRARLLLPVPACCFCDAATGVRVQCRHLHCGKFFHVRCAHTSHHGHVGVEHVPFRQSHVYCDRHRRSHPNLNALASKLASTTVTNALPREVATKITGAMQSITSYTTVDALLVDVTSALVELCQRGLQASKADPPRYMMKHLQVLALVLDHLPPLYTVYDATALSKSVADLVQDPDLLVTLQKAFSPQRFVRKFAGALSQHHRCDHCHAPFQERQRVFYCTSTEQPHALHWRCTKRKSATKDASKTAAKSKKIKAVALIQQGHWKDVKLPKGLPRISEGVSCSVCRAAMDATGLISGRKETTKLDFEKPAGDFMFGGSFANEQDARTAAAAGLMTTRVSAASARKAAAVKSVAAPPAKRASQMLDLEAGDSQVVLGPPKMERINVRRTTRWLACLAQVIRLVMATRKQEATVQTVDAHDTMPTATGEEGSAQPPPAGATDATSDEQQSESRPAPAVDKGEAAVRVQPEPEAEEPAALVKTEPSDSPSSTLPKLALAYLAEAKKVVRKYDLYALQTMETAQRMLEQHSGPGLSLLHTLVQDYTRFVYIKHTRAVAKASSDKRKRLEQEANEARDRERKRMDQEAELALKKQMQAMRKKARV